MAWESLACSMASGANADWDNAGAASACPNENGPRSGCTGRPRCGRHDAGLETEDLETPRCSLRLHLRATAASGDRVAGRRLHNVHHRESSFRFVPPITHIAPSAVSGNCPRGRPHQQHGQRVLAHRGAEIRIKRRGVKDLRIPLVISSQCIFAETNSSRK